MLKKSMLRQRKKMITGHIVNEEEKDYKQKVVKTINQMSREGQGIMEENFLAFKKKLEPKKYQEQ